MHIRAVKLVLGDQLYSGHSWFQTPDDQTLYVMMELRQETDYVRHHIQKVLGFFAAMREFARELRAQGHTVRYITLDDKQNTNNLCDNLEQILNETGARRFEYQLPDEYRLDKQLSEFAAHLQQRGIETHAADTEHFLSSRTDVAEIFRGKKTYLLETFYRAMRRKYGVLMDGSGPKAIPHTGQWNYDAENRKKLPKTQTIPEPIVFRHDVSDLLEMLTQSGVQTFGRVNPQEFFWCINRAEALEILEFFASECLPNFGTYQDAMTVRGWSLFHARLSFAMNTKMLHPLEVVERCIHEWQSRPEEISYAQIEGFVRQIIGWREYMRGVYWAKMPEYATLNALNHTATLPAWYWTGETDMNCLKHAVNQSLDYSYAHHIQRLMVTGNFALLLGVHPDEVDAWYLGVYMDAIEWVEITNTRGMSQFADGGIVGTKPYISSANYIDKMSDYCAGCKYDKSKRHGENACPFNSLYWDFYDRHRDKFAKNPRIAVMYKTLDAMSAEERTATLKHAAHLKQHANEL
ncbi:MAG: cryptochrome/photolyase family protein [Candidatus Kapabacteria bacterium]|jgi:deoxyribodipyrimidine photolyase-related protein|nr:cryptochrome/photolyase family protein [Candidatus Kapabacteria bacterium]